MRIVRASRPLRVGIARVRLRRAVQLGLASAPMNSSSPVNIVSVNRDTARRLNPELMLPTGPSLETTNGVTIQGAMVAQDHRFSPTRPTY